MGFLLCFVALLSTAHSSSLLQVGAGGSITFTSEQTREADIAAPEAPSAEFRSKPIRQGSCSDGSTQLGFGDFMRFHGRAYTPGSDEYKMRMRLFQRRMQEAQAHNCKSGKRLWIAGPTSLSDRTDEELARIRGFKPARGANGFSTFGPAEAHGRFAALSSEVHPRRGKSWPKTFSWANLPVAKKVMDQGSCGSCWASATALMLRAHTNIYGEDRHFSVQQLVSCVPNPEQCGGDGGCNGSTGELALDYVMHNGLETESSIPYTGRDDECHPAKKARNSKPIPQPSSSQSLNLSAFHMSSAPSMEFGMVGWSKLPSNKLAPLFRALYQEGPVAVSIVAGMEWNMYSKGIMDDCSTNDMVVNHLVVLMGYGEDTHLESKYWQLQNSWGNSWGEEGHMRMIRLDDEKEADFCGWDTDPSIGTGCKGGPSKVWACGSCGILYDSVVAHFQGESSMAKTMMKRRDASKE